MANTYRQWRTGRAAQGGSLGPGGMGCGRMAPSTPSATPSAAAGSSCGQEQLAAEALAATHSRSQGGTVEPQPWLSGGLYPQSQRPRLISRSGLTCRAWY